MSGMICLDWLRKNCVAPPRSFPLWISSKEAKLRESMIIACHKATPEIVDLSTSGLLGKIVTWNLAFFKSSQSLRWICSKATVMSELTPWFQHVLTLWRRIQSDFFPTCSVPCGWMNIPGDSSLATDGCGQPRLHWIECFFACPLVTVCYGNHLFSER